MNRIPKIFQKFSFSDIFCVLFLKLKSISHLMLIKLIIQRINIDSREQLEDIEWRSEFYKLWRENDVYVLGNWYNVNDPSEDYTITVYKDENHYQKFVKKMKKNEIYVKLSTKLGKIRERIKIVTLQYDPLSPMIPSLTDVTSYIDELLLIKARL